ncbi:MAG: hypothetical protein KGL39_47990 [Patescibacteria group bacterium]|nr:hypothetical protein [Patescibacteria group bacterium]
MKKIIAKLNFQQGDVIGRKVESLPAGEQKIIGRKRLVLAHGESGHSHVIEDDEAVMVQVGEAVYLQLEKTATVKHEEHKPVTLSPGLWEIGRVKEFDYFEMMSRQILD